MPGTGAHALTTTHAAALVHSHALTLAHALAGAHADTRLRSRRISGGTAAYALALALTQHGTLALARAHAVLVRVGVFGAADGAVPVSVHLLEAQRVAAGAGTLGTVAVQFLLGDHAIAVAVDGGEIGTRLRRGGQAETGQQGGCSEGRQDADGFFHDALLSEGKKANGLHTLFIFRSA